MNTPAIPQSNAATIPQSTAATRPRRVLGIPTDPQTDGVSTVRADETGKTRAGAPKERRTQNGDATASLSDDNAQRHSNEVSPAFYGSNVPKEVSKPELNLKVRRWIKPSHLSMQLSSGSPTIFNITTIWKGPKKPGIYFDQKNNLGVYYDPNGTVLCVEMVSAEDPNDRLKKPTYVSEILIDPKWVIPDGIKEEKRSKGESTADVPGGITANPKGAAHLRLGGGSQLLHGTAPKTLKLIGKDNGDNLAGNPDAQYSHGCGRMPNGFVTMLAHVIPDNCPVIPYVMDKTQLAAIYALGKQQKVADTLAMRDFVESIQQEEVARAEIKKSRSNTTELASNVPYRLIKQEETNRPAVKYTSLSLHNQSRLGDKPSYKQSVKLANADEQIGRIAKRKKANASNVPDRSSHLAASKADRHNDQPARSASSPHKHVAATGLRENRDVKNSRFADQSSAKNKVSTRDAKKPTRDVGETRGEARAEDARREKARGNKGSGRRPITFADNTGRSSSR